MLGTGLLLYMLSKEIYVINHETFAAASIGAVIIYGIKKFGPSVAAFADKLNEVCGDYCFNKKSPSAGMFNIVHDLTNGWLFVYG